MMVKLGVRWTIGSVSKRGFEALRLSIHGAVLVFGEEAAYAVYVNSMTIEEARSLTGPVPNFVEWRYASTEVPAVLSGYVDAGMAEGVAWKFAPLSAFPDRHELALDNDVILWQAPGAIRQWLDERPEARVLAEDVALGHGAFSYLCGPEPRNSGIRGTPLGYDFADALGRTLCNAPVQLQSELDEQGLQIAALSLDGPPLVVTTAEVTICSPFWPHQWHLGYCGAHFVGLNPECIPWTYYERPATQVRIEHWEHHRPELYARVGLQMPCG